MDEKAKQARRLYNREYYARNRAKITAQHEAYWKRRAEKLTVPPTDSTPPDNVQTHPE